MIALFFLGLFFIAAAVMLVFGFWFARRMRDEDNEI
jgi:hypothetical protein